MVKEVRPDDPRILSPTFSIGIQVLEVLGSDFGDDTDSSEDDIVYTRSKAVHSYMRPSVEMRKGVSDVLQAKSPAQQRSTTTPPPLTPLNGGVGNQGNN